MAKGQMRTNKEKKKPKAEQDKKKGTSAYAAAYGQAKPAVSAFNPPGKKS
jgi:hypothetical protein